MPICPECESPLDFDPEEVDEGDVLNCDECGIELEVVGTDPLELARVEEEEGAEDEDYDEEEKE